MDRFVGKVAVVTGSSGGIGSAISAALLQKNVTVVGLDLNIDKLKTLEEELNNSKSYTSKFYTRKCNVSDEEDIKSTFRWIEENVGPVYILVNAAGVAYGGQRKPLSEAEGKDFDSILQVNSRGLLLCANEAFNSMIKNNIAGHIVNICSVLGHDQYLGYGFGLYSASKYAVRVFSEELQSEVKKRKLDIKITNVSPGLVNTELIRSKNYTIPEDKKQILSPEDVANGCVSVIDTPPNVLISQFTIQPIHY